MNKQWKLLIGTLLSLLMYSCSVVDEEEQNDVVNIKDASELYGTWEYESSSILSGYLGDNTTPYYYVLSKDTAYFIQRSYSYAFIPVMTQWELTDSITITMKPELNGINWLLVNYWLDIDNPIPTQAQIMNNDTTWVYTFSEVDSIVETHNLYSSEKAKITEYVIIDLSNTHMSMVTDSCYKANNGVASIEDHCDVTNYIKNNNLDVKAILSNVDTVPGKLLREKLLNPY